MGGFGQRPAQAEAGVPASRAGFHRAAEETPGREGAHRAVADTDDRAGAHHVSAPPFGPGPLRSIGVRILLPVLVATVGLVTLGVMQTRDALTESARAGDARILARTASTGIAVAHQAELEHAETIALRLRGGEAGKQLLEAQRARTDAARERYSAAAREARVAAPALAAKLDAADGVLDLLPGVRAMAVNAPDGSPEVFDAYNAVTHAMIGIADAVPSQLTEPRLLESARAVVLVTELEHLAAEQLDLLRRVFNRESLEPGELVRLAAWEGAEHHQLEVIERLPGPTGARFDALVSGNDVTRARGMRDKVLSTGGSPASLKVDPDVWYAAQSGLLRRLRLMQSELSTTMEREAYDLQVAAHKRTLATAALTSLLVGLALAGAAIQAVRTSRRLRRMRATALTVAHGELPTAVARVSAARDESGVRDTLEASGARVDSMLPPGVDEIGELSTAFATMHRQALWLAAEQALQRMETTATFTALSRRGQTLVQRQLHLIGEFARQEGDPGSRARLFALDHLAARMRRNEENLLVLAGGDPGRRFTDAVPIREMIQLAAAEIEEPARVDAVATPLLAVSAHVVGDVVHLLAELLENAASFSPPATSVRVAARQAVDHVTLTIFDEGIGLTAERLAEANKRIAHPSALTSTLVGTMGLLVVGRLAARHGIRVQLTSVAGGGTAATLTLPDRVLAPLPPPPRFYRGQLLGPLPDPAPSAAPPRAGEAQPEEPVRLAPVRMAPATVDGITAAGLPKRAPAQALPSGPVAGRLPAPPAPPRQRAGGTPDPDEVRARLSSLASGIAAGRRTAPPQSTAPPSAAAPPALSSPSPEDAHDEPRYGLPTGPRRLR
ncbi:sensor histidine kinase [Phytohabitans kaempferiae]|uniref:histidine kinase n=1 Tax=Phytohabitans kaempferiae TaxID=1620943 RepID=A0ABV6MGU2_9ACTN